MKLSDKVWFYVNRRVDVDWVLPSEDEIFNKFECDSSVIREAVESVVGCTDMEGVKIEWEGELDGISHRRITSESEISSQTA